MAATDRPFSVHFLVSFSLIVSHFFVAQAIQEYRLSCGQKIDLINSYDNAQSHSGVLQVSLPSTFAQFQDESNPKYCDIVIMFDHTKHLLIELYYVDIIPLSNTAGCDTGLEVFDNSGGRSDIYGRVCGKAWEWEQKHRELQQEKKVSRSSPVTFRLVSGTNSFEGNGFKAHFNEFRPQIPCPSREFMCEEYQRCIHEDLTCDGWDDCGDRSDEEEKAGCQLLTETEICAVFVGILFVLSDITIIVVFFFIYQRHQRDNAFSESKIPIADDARSIPESAITFNTRYTSQESMNKSGYLKNGGRSREYFDDKNEMDRRTLDTVSERSYKKSRTSLADEKRSGSRMNGIDAGERGSRDRSRDRSSRDRRSRDRRSDSDTDDRNDDRGYRRRRSRERSRDRYSDDSDYERERDRRRKRRSYYSDEESDSERDRRRRSRSRSYHRYSDEDSDSERERERRRRRRSKDKYRDRKDDRDRRGGSDEQNLNGDKTGEKPEDKPSDGTSERDRPRPEDRDREYDRSRDSDRDSERPYRRRRSRERGPPPNEERENKKEDPTDDQDNDRRRRRSAERRPYRDDEDSGRNPSPDGRYRNDRRAGSRDNLRSRDSEPAPSPSGEDVRKYGIESQPEAGQLGREAVKEYKRRSMDDRRGRRRSRGPPGNEPNAEGPPVYEDVATPQSFGSGGYKEAAV